MEASRRTRPTTDCARITVVGDVILDRDLIGDVHRLCPDAPAPVLELRETRERAGGAGLAAILLAAAGHDVTLVTSIGPDGAGAAVRRLLSGAASPVKVVEAAGADRTRSVSRVRSGGQSIVRIDTEGDRVAGDAPVDTLAIEAALDDADAVLVSDYGAGLAAHPRVREAVRHAAGRCPLVWDPHPRGPAPVPGTAVVTPNRAEALASARASGLATGSLDGAARALRERWRVHAVAATDGATGVFTALADSPPLFTPTPYTHDGDTCGAGDRFAGAVTAALAAGAVITEAVAAAVEDTAAWLSAGGVAAPISPVIKEKRSLATSPDAPSDALPDAFVVARTTRAAGGTVVATGGCFDVVHAGHVASLQAARRLGDCLVVLLNSDDAVRRLKGPTRPVHGVRDRAAVLTSLECVDAVLVFDDVTPVAALDLLRPDVWAKGGDYAEATLPEGELVAGWGGRVVLLPYLPGRSTTSILNRTAPAPSPSPSPSPEGPHR